MFVVLIAIHFNVWHAAWLKNISMPIQGVPEKAKRPFYQYDIWLPRKC